MNFRNYFELYQNRTMKTLISSYSTIYVWDEE